MNRIVVFVGLAVALILGVGALGAAQDAAPGAGSETGDVCASPEATPVEIVVLATPDVDLGASPVGSPEAAPAALVVCASPAVGTPAPISEVAAEASPV